MSVFQLIYASHPFGFDDLDLVGILAAARRHNVPANLTGALICREDLYLQLLEGDEAAVRSTYERIAKDKRHVDVSLKWTGTAQARLFPDWAMRHDPARSWMWSRDEVSGGAVDAASAQEMLGIFERVAATPPDTPQTCPMARKAA